MACTPVSSVGWMTGANVGLWFVGCPARRGPPARPCRRGRRRCRHVPEDRGRAPLGAERAEVLAGEDRRCELVDAVVAELAAQRGGHAGRAVGVVHGQRVVLGHRDLRRPRRSRGGRLRLDDPLDRVQHVRAHLVVRARATTTQSAVSIEQRAISRIVRAWLEALAPIAGVTRPLTWPGLPIPTRGEDPARASAARAASGSWPSRTGCPGARPPAERSGRPSR